MRSPVTDSIIRFKLKQVRAHLVSMSQQSTLVTKNTEFFILKSNINKISISSTNALCLFQWNSDIDNNFESHIRAMNSVTTIIGFEGTDERLLRGFIILFVHVISYNYFIREYNIGSFPQGVTFNHEYFHNNSY